MMMAGSWHEGMMLSGPWHNLGMMLAGPGSTETLNRLFTCLPCAAQVAFIENKALVEV